MLFPNSRSAVYFAMMAFSLILAQTGVLAAQTAAGTLRGTVTDPSGSVVPRAKVVVITPAGQLSTVTDHDGMYEVSRVQAGTCTVQVTAPGFAAYQKKDVQIAAGKVQTLAISLSVQELQEKVEVSSEAIKVDVDPTNNAGALVIKGTDLDALPDDPDDLEADLEALAGPSAGPNGGQMYIDGFTAGQLPPKSSIREIRINQNPFSSEYDKVGYGRIEIFTKPGTDTYHGQMEIMGNDSAFNSRNPFATSEPSYNSTTFMGNLNGPINKKASFFLSVQRRDINNVSVVRASVLDPNFNVVPFSDSVVNPQTRTNFSPRIDYQLTKNNTLSVRYQYFRNSAQNQGIGQFNLATQGYNSFSSEQQVQVSDTQVFGPKVVNETHFQYLHDASNQTAQTSGPTISVLGAFTGGGSNSGNSSDTSNRYEFQNYTSMILGKHVLKYGGRLRQATDSIVSNAAFNGMFTFFSISAYQIMERGLSQNLSTAQIIANGGGPSQYSITTGIPTTSASMFDAGLYLQDDWRVRTNVTVSLGLRFETQNRISDHADWAPRLAVAWGLGKNTVLRVGSGIFYDRFSESNVLQVARLNGVRQEQFIVPSPNFLPPNAPLPNTIPAVQPTIYQIAPNFRAPGTLQSAVTLERQLTKTAKLSVSYMNSRGFDQQLTNSINTPNPATGVRPYGNVGNIYQYLSEGIFRENQLSTNITVRAGAKVSINGRYTLTQANSEVAGGSPSNPYDFMADYGRASFAVRNQGMLMGSITLPHSFSLSPMLQVSSGQPFNITLGKDLIGSSLFNQRPTFASNLSNPSNVVVTSLGSFDMVPVAGETLVPINYGTGPAQFTLNLRLSKTFGFGKKVERSGGAGPGGGFPGGGGGGMRGGGRGGGGGFGGGFGGGRPGGAANSQSRRFNMTFSVYARNVLNKVNLAPPIGVLTSPFFDQSIAMAGGGAGGAANRTIQLQTTISF